MEKCHNRVTSQKNPEIVMKLRNSIEVHSRHTKRNNATDQQTYLITLNNLDRKINKFKNTKFPNGSLNPIPRNAKKTQKNTLNPKEIAPEIEILKSPKILPFAPTIKSESLGPGYYRHCFDQSITGGYISNIPRFDAGNSLMYQKYLMKAPFSSERQRVMCKTTKDRNPAHERDLPKNREKEQMRKELQTMAKKLIDLRVKETLIEKMHEKRQRQN